MIDSDLEYLNGLRTSSRTALRAAIGNTAGVAILDAPNQRNVGDSLIWAGELAYLKALGLPLRYVSDLRSYDPQALRRMMPEGVILLHGGGNLGDLWLGHQRLREQVAHDLRDYRVVQLPQSIHFQDADRAAAANEKLGVHPDFHMLIRDTLSMEKAASLLPDVRASFCHDMALGWDAPQVDDDGASGVLVIAREDVEAVSGLANAVASRGADDFTLTDWHIDEARTRAWLAARRTTEHFRRYASLRSRYMAWLPTGVADRSAARAISRINRLNIEVATDLYAAHAGVITDRLHAHVLAALLGRPHVVLDNSYRKVSTIYNNYTGGFSTAHYATSADEALELYSSFAEV